MPRRPGSITPRRRAARHSPSPDEGAKVTGALLDLRERRAGADAAAAPQGRDHGLQRLPVLHLHRRHHLAPSHVEGADDEGRLAQGVDGEARLDSGVELDDEEGGHAARGGRGRRSFGRREGTVWRGRPVPRVGSAPTAVYGMRTAAPVSWPSRRSASASFAASSGYAVVSVRTGTRGARARKSSPSRRGRFATERGVRSSHSSRYGIDGTSLMWMPPETTAPPRSTAFSAAGTRAPTGAKSSAASSGSGGASVDAPAQAAPRRRANACPSASPSRVNA